MVPLQATSGAILERSGRKLPFNICDLRRSIRILNLSGIVGNGAEQESGAAASAEVEATADVALLGDEGGKRDGTDADTGVVVIFGDRVMFEFTGGDRLWARALIKDPCKPGSDSICMEESNETGSVVTLGTSCCTRLGKLIDPLRVVRAENLGDISPTDMFGVTLGEFEPQVNGVSVHV